MPASPRQLVEERLTQLSADLEALFAESREQARRVLADQLNQLVRRLRLAPDADELCATLADGASRFAAGALLFRLAGGTATHERIEIPLADAPALSAAGAMQEPLVVLATAAEVSAPLVELLGHEDGARAHLYPVTVGESVPALLYTWGDVVGPSLELLTLVAGAVWSAMISAAPQPQPDAAVDAVPAPELVTIAAAPAPPPEPVPAAAPAPEPSPPRKPAATWEELSPAEQQVHLRAQRFARVHVAEMRLLYAEAVQNGRTRRDLYQALREPIDSARTAFREQFFNCPSMVDYLDLELTRTLAHEDPELLGQSYPGPLV